MAKPGRGWAALIETTGGSVIAISSRGCMVSVDGSMRWFRPAVISGLVIDQALAEPLSGVPAYDDVQLEIENTGWWIADHITTDRLDGAAMTIWRETAGTFDPDADVQWKGFVLRRGGVSANNHSVRLTCRDVFGFYAEGATIGGVNTLNRDTFPAVAPPTPISITINAIGGASSEDITSLVFATSNGFGPYAYPYAGPWPVGPVPVAGISNGTNITFIVAGKNSGGTTIFLGSATGDISHGIPARIWISPDDVEASPPEEIGNTDEDKPIPVIFGKYGGNDLDPVPCLCYDPGVTSSSEFKYVYEDLTDVNGDVMQSKTAGNNHVYCIDTKPPTTDANGDPIENPRTFTDFRTSFEAGEYYVIRDNGDDVGAAEGALIQWHAPGGPGNKFGCFTLNAGVFNYWAQKLFNNPDLTFDPERFKLFTGVGGARCNDPSMPVGASAWKPLGTAVRILVEHIGIPAEYIDWDAITPIDDSLDAKPHRYITSGESAADLYASLLEECQILHFIRSDGRISWEINQVNAPPPAVVSFDERNTIRDSIEWTANDWGPRFNAVNGQRDQGIPYALDQGLSPRPEITIEGGIPEGVEKTPYSYTFKWLWDAANMDDFLRALLRVQGTPGDTVKVTGHLDESSVATGYTIRAGNTIKYAYIASRVDLEVRRLIERGSLFRVLRVGHDMDHAEHQLTLWRMGSDPTYVQGSMLMMGGDEVFSDGSAVGLVWDAGWPDWKKREAANWGSGMGGWMSETEDQILIADTSPYAVSPMG